MPSGNTDLDRLLRSLLSRSRSLLLERRRSLLRLLFRSFSFFSLRLSRLLERLLRLRSLLRERFRRSDRLRDRERDRFLLLRLGPSAAPLELDLPSLQEMEVSIELMHQNRIMKFIYQYITQQ